jgi:hypothetical protein
MSPIQAARRRAFLLPATPDSGLPTVGHHRTPAYLFRRDGLAPQAPGKHNLLKKAQCFSVPVPRNGSPWAHAYNAHYITREGAADYHSRD